MVDSPDVNIPECNEPVIPTEGYAATVPSALNTASKDKFLLVLTIPSILKKYQSKFIRNNSRFDPDTLIYKVYGLNIPAIKVPPIKTKTGGYTFKLSSHARDDYESAKVNFVVDSGFQNYHFLYKWLDVLAGEDGGNFDAKNLGGNKMGLNAYSTDITLFGLDEYDRMVAEFKYSGAFITDLGGIEYNYQTEKEIQSTFTFEYSFFKMELIDEPISIHPI